MHVNTVSILIFIVINHNYIVNQKHNDNLILNRCKLETCIREISNYYLKN